MEVLRGKGLDISGDAIESGLSDIDWPGRIEKISSNPTIILDGAHNPPAMGALANSIEHDFDYEQLILVLGILEDKDIDSIIKRILPLANRVIYTRPTYERAADPHYLKDKAGEVGKAGEVCLSIPVAIDRARNVAGKRDLILITGSLYTVGEAKSYFDPVRYPIEEI